MRLVPRLLAGALGLVALVLWGLVWCGTPSGTRWLLQQVPGLEVTRIQGGLGSRLVLGGVRWQLPSGRLELERLRLSWYPAALWQGHVAIHSLILTAPAWHPEKDVLADSTPPSPLALPRLPAGFLDGLGGRLQQLKLQGPVRLGEKTLALESLASSLRLHQGRLFLEPLTLRGAGADLTLNGWLGLTGGFPLDVSTRAQGPLPENEWLQAEGRVTGTLTDLKLDQHLQGALEGRLQLQLQPLEQPLSWQGTLEGRRNQALPASPLDLAYPLGFRVQGQGQGDQLQARLAGTDAHSRRLQADLVFDPSRLQLQHLEVTWPRAAPGPSSTTKVRPATQSTSSQPELVPHTRAPLPAMKVSLQGSLQPPWDSPEVDLDGRWQNLGYPFLQPQWRSPQGRFQVQGTPEDYRLAAEAALNPPEGLPDLEFSLQGRGDPGGLSQLEARLLSAAGSGRYQGELSWSPRLAWKGHLAGEGLRPGDIRPGWPGIFDFSAATRGRLEAGELQAVADIGALSARLGEHRFEARARLQYGQGRLELQDARLDLDGAGEIQASGHLGSTLALQARGRLDRPGVFLAGASGRLKGQLGLEGSRERPSLELRLQGDDLEADAWQLEHLSAALDWRPGASGAALSAGDGRLQLSLRSPRWQAQAWDTLSLKAQGRLAAHALEVDLEGAPLTAGLRARGGYDQGSWRGHLRALRLQRGQLAPWVLEGRPELMLQADSLSLGRSCLHPVRAEARQVPGAVCLEGGWARAGVSQLEFSLSDLPLAQLPLPPAAEILAANLEGQGRLAFHDGQPQRLKGRLALREGRLAWPGGDPLSLASTSLDFDGNTQALRVQGQARVADLEGFADLDARLARPLEAGHLEASLSAGLDSWPRLGSLVPWMAEPQGRLRLNLELEGAPRQWQWRARARLSEASVSLPAAGIRLEPLSLNLETLAAEPGSPLHLEGSAVSGQGRLDLEGEVKPRQQSLRLQLEGENFLAWDTANARLEASPRLVLELDPQWLRLNGEVLIPRARLRPPQGRQRISPSDEVRRLDAGSRAARGRQQQVGVRLRLGDEVHFEGYGIEARLLGNLLLETEPGRGTSATGTLEVASGEYRLYGQDLRIDRGQFLFSGGPPDNPGLDFRISRDLGEVFVGAHISGRLQDSRLELTSSPAMSDYEKAYWLVRGQAPGSGGEVDERTLALQMALAGGNKLGESLSERLPVDDLGFAGEAEDASVYIGKYLSPRLYVRYGVGLLEPLSTFLVRYQLSDRWSLESTTDAETQSADLIFTLER